MESIWWERYNSNGTMQPEAGGVLEQDWQLAEDLKTYSWLWGLANAKLDGYAEEGRRAKELLESRRPR